MQSRSGAIVTTQPVGRLMDAASPAEWFATNPIDPSVVTFPGAGGLLGAAVMTDAAMSASAAPISSQLLGGVMRQVATVSLAAAGQLPRVAKYVRLRAANAVNGPLTWVLREIRMRPPPNTAQLAPGAARILADQRISIRRLTLRQPVYQTTSSGLTPTSSAIKLFIVPEEPNPWDPTPIPPLPPEPDPVPPPPPPPATVPLPPMDGSDVPVVFQHGFQSNATAWTEMRNRLHPQLRMDDAAFSLPVTGDLFAASESLNVETRNRFGSRRVLAVAHSAGGLVSRRAIFRDPSLISGLIAVGTPHRGALLAERGQDMSAGFGALIPAIWVASPCVTGLFDSNSLMCSQIAIFGGGAIGSIIGILGSDAFGLGNARHLEPSSTFVNDVNAPAESYVRVGITHRVPRRWSLGMYVAEYTNSPLPWNPTFASRGSYEMSSAYRRALITFIQSTVMIWVLSEMERDQGRLRIDNSCGPAWTSPAAGCGYDPATSAATRWAYTSSWYTYRLQQQALAGGTVLTFNIGDWLWNKSVADNRSSDSFIAAESQQFPNNPGSAIPPINIETDRSFGRGPLVGHSGETRSDMTFSPLVLALQGRFGVLPRPF